MMNNKSFNKTIKSFLNSYTQFDKNMKTRLRADDLFLCFDDKANKDFSNFVNLSNTRYKALKYGRDLNDVLTKQKNTYSFLNNQIKKEIIYNSPSIQSEEKKLKKSVNTSQNKEISNLRQNVFSSLKPEKPSNIQKIKSSINFKDMKNKDNIFNLSISGFNKNYIFKNNNEKLADDVIKDDYNNFKNGMKNYHQLLNDVKDLTNFDLNNTVKIDRNKFNDIEYSLRLKNISSLSFRGNSNRKHDLNSLRKNNEDVLDIKRLLKIKADSDIQTKKNFFKAGYKTKFSDEKSSNLQTLPNFCSNNNKNYFETDNEKPIIKTENNFNFNRKTEMKKRNLNLKDTKSIIKNEANKGLELNENIFTKRKKFDEEFAKLCTSQMTQKNKKIKKKLIHEKLMKINGYCDKSKQKYSEKHYVDSNERHAKKIDTGIKILDNYLKFYDTDINKWIEEVQSKKEKNSTYSKEEF